MPMGLLGAIGAVPLPAGGNVGEYVAKNSSVDGDVDWAVPLWNDYKAHFTSAAKGSGTPTLTALPNGHQLIKFGVNDSMFVEFHVLHDYKPLSDAFIHIHWIPGTTMVLGQTVVWELSYVIARGHHQGEVLGGARTVLTLTHTADGTELAFEHMLDEDVTGIDLLEPDTQIFVEVKRLAGTYAGDVFGIQADIHYQMATIGTPQKEPDFYEVTP